MKLLQINAVYGYGSTGVIVKDIHEMCLHVGIDSYVAYSISAQTNEKIENGYVIGSTLGKKLHAFLCRINGKQAYFSTHATKKLIDHIAEISPDVVHLHNLHSNYINLNLLLKYLADNNIKTVITLHDCWFYTGGCFHYTEAQCFRWKQKCGNCPKKHSDTVAYVFDASRKILNDRKKYFSKIENLYTVGVSEWIASEAKKTFLSNSKVTTIYNGIDLDFFKHTNSDIREKLAIDKADFVILGMANKWLLPINAEALVYFSSNLPHNSIMLLVGCSDEQIKQLPKNVKGIGYIKDRLQLRNIYSVSDVFVNCTREESLSLVNIEAQACETPVVTYRNTGAKETVDNINSFSVDTCDYVAMFKKVMEIKLNRDYNYGSKSRDFVKKKFDKNKNYSEYIELYRKIQEDATMNQSERK